MDAATVANALATAHELYIRAENATAGNSTADAHEPGTVERPPVYKVIGISLAISSGAFIGTSFVLKKVGLLRANEKYNEEAGEGYGYLKNAYWWSGMTLMIIGEVCNFVAYAFTDAILVTPLGALSVVITTILSAIFLKERLSMVGKVACFLCIVGSVVIVMNAPQESSVANIQQMQSFVIAPGFLSFTGVVIIGSAIAAFWAGPKWGKKNMLVYLSICSWVGGLSVVATQGLGSAIVAQAGGQQQFNQWFLYVLLVFVIATLLTEIIFLNKALNLFNAAMVTPTYYVYFTSTTIITSTVLFRGFKGTPTSIITVVNGFLTICSGVVLLQLSKSAKDVPDAAVFSGNLDQIHTIAEQEQPESEPKADAIRGAAAIVRRFSVARQNMELEEFKRMQEEKKRERLDALEEEGQAPTYEWDGLRRRKTIYGVGTGAGSQRGRAMTVGSPISHSNPFRDNPNPLPEAHPPLGWSHVPTDEELAERDARPGSPGVLSSIAGTIRTRTRSIIGNPGGASQDPTKVQSPMHPVQLTEIAVPKQHSATPEAGSGSYFGQETGYGLPASPGKTEYQGSGASGPHVQFGGDSRNASQGSVSVASSAAPEGPIHSARRQFSFQNVFRRHQQHGAAASGQGFDGALDDSPPRPRSRPGITSRGYSNPQVKGSTEEERLGLVKGDSHSMPALPSFTEEEEDPYSDDKAARYGRGITTPPRRGSDEKEGAAEYEAQRKRFNERSGAGSRIGSEGEAPTAPPEGSRRHSPPRGGNGAFI